MSANQSDEQGEPNASSAIWQDERFQHLVTDPRFKSLPKLQRKVKIDKRFQGMFTDERFKVKYTVDKYGRKVNQSNAEDLKKYYELDSDATATDDEEQQEQLKEEQAITQQTDDVALASASDNDEESPMPLSLKERLLDPNVDYARGEGRLLTDSSSDDESSEDEQPEMFIDHVWGELDADAPMTEESTRRLAACNMDWDRIRAIDLMVLFSSFLPPGGSILSVKIYPSEYGKERMAEEEVRGPQELLKKQNKDDDDSDVDEDSTEENEDIVQEQDSDAEQGDDYHMEKLRQYQLNRLRYYYAVIECNNVQSADKIYKECDGIEYESSATRIDLRFVPDDTSFETDKPSDVCTELPDASSYKPRQFTTTALQQVKVDLTWDETALERKELSDKLLSGKIDEVSDKDLRKIVAYSSEEEQEEQVQVQEQENDKSVILKEKKEPAETVKAKSSKKEDYIAKYKALLQEINEKEEQEKNNKKYEMEFTWKIDENASETAAKDDKDSTAAVNNKADLTPIERVLQKRSEKNKQRKQERKKKKLLAQGIDVDATATNDSDEDSLPDGIDLNDAYFAEEFANGDFIDTKMANKQSKTQQKLQKKKALELAEAEAAEAAKELQLLLDDDDDINGTQSKKHFSLQKIIKAEDDNKSKRKRRKLLKKSKAAIAEARQEIADNFELNLHDSRFGAIYTSHLFNIDPSDSHFKKTKGMESIIQEKLKRRNNAEHNTQLMKHDDGDETLQTKRPKMKQLENTLLIKNLKRKIKMKQN